MKKLTAQGKSGVRLHLQFFVIMVFTVSFLLQGCNKNNSFLSGGKLRSKVAGTWRLQPLLDSDKDEVWSFEDGKVIRALPDGTIIDQAGYEVMPKPYGSKLVITGFDQDMYNGKWHIVNIQDKVMQLNIKYRCENGAKSCGTFEREFYR